MLVSMGDDRNRAVTVSDYVDRLAGPAGLGFSYSSREIRQRAALVRRLRAELTPEQYEAVLGEIPKGYAEGFVGKDDQYRRERNRLAGSHPRRLRMLDRAEGLPFSEFEDLIYHTADTIFSATPPDVASYWVTYESDQRQQREALARLAADTLRLLRLLILLSLADHRRYPTTLLLLLLQVLSGMAIAMHVVCWPVPASTPVRVTRPPGRVVVASPRVARAPGVGGPSLSIAARAGAGCARTRGNAVVP
ncbi:hypothetical protein JOF56_004163 [Kibdelosporangium banguiense]|uniref:DUF4158 domain-containing protein n=1 Tax=Kibdelosporangium banguiense TaxID=1365924 RepID=A0ABS4TH71_9PSEU|nr:hypothetical protein [Kibdelosporangium banguiense]MBP2323778.1 hypothetical protein [Kibdelosporangium banguiense]